MHVCVNLSISESERIKIVHQYSNNELMDMILAYEAVNENYEVAARLYAQR